MSHKQECPSCRKGANEGHLRPNPIVEEIINGWKDARYVREPMSLSYLANVRSSQAIYTISLEARGAKKGG